MKIVITIATNKTTDAAIQNMVAPMMVVPMEEDRREIIATTIVREKTRGMVARGPEAKIENNGDTPDKVTKVISVNPEVATPALKVGTANTATDIHLDVRVEAVTHRNASLR